MNYPPPPQQGPPQVSTNISVGGPGGIQIQGHGVQPAHSHEVAPPAQGPSVYRNPWSELEKVFQSHPKLALLSLFGGGFTMLVMSTVLLSLGSAAFLIPGFAALLPLAAAGMLMKRKKQPIAALDQDLESSIIALAMRSGGVLSVTQTAHELDLPLDHAETALMEIAYKGHVDIDNHPESGHVIYVFRDIKTQTALS